MDAAADLAAGPRYRPRPERMVLDVQITVGAYRLGRKEQRIRGDQEGSCDQYSLAVYYRCIAVSTLQPRYYSLYRSAIATALPLYCSALPTTLPLYCSTLPTALHSLQPLALAPSVVMPPPSLNPPATSPPPGPRCCPQRLPHHGPPGLPAARAAEPDHAAVTGLLAPVP